MSCENCILKEQFDALKEKVEKIKEELSSVKIENAETKVYIKQIFERLEEIKPLSSEVSEIKTLLISYKPEKRKTEETSQPKKESELKPIVLELLKLLGTVITILAALAGYNMIIGG